MSINNASYKVIAAEYDSLTGISTVKLDTNLGEIWGDAFLHPEDKEFESKYTGCEIARLRAVNQYWLQVKNEKQKELKLLNDFLKELRGLRKFDNNEIAVRQLYRKMNRLNKDIENIKDIRFRIKEAIKRHSDESNAIKIKMRNLANENKDKED